jgi:hypothetical protein
MVLLTLQAAKEKNLGETDDLAGLKTWLSLIAYVLIGDRLLD